MNLAEMLIGYGTPQKESYFTSEANLAIFAPESDMVIWQLNSEASHIYVRISTW